MATKEMDLRSGTKGKGLCICCDSPNCGKRKGPYPKKHKPYLDGKKQRVSWRGDPTGYNNDYLVKREKVINIGDAA